jgi:lysophospholipase L1-like esterase
MTRRVVAALLYLLVLAVPAFAQLPASRRETNVPRDIAAFEASDRVSPPPKGEVVFVGSSTVVLWDLPNQFPDLKAIGRGMWGSTLADTVRNVDLLVIAHEPRLVVVYAGENDIDVGSTSELVAVQFEQLVKSVHAKLPATRILFIGLKPTIRRWLEVDRMRLANDLIRSICARDDRLAYLDVDGIMMGWDERPRRELFQDDGLHLSAEGYRLLSIVVRPFLASPAPTAR